MDLQAARERGVVVFNAPFSNTRSVTELVLAEAILFLRGVPPKNAAAHRGSWLKSADDACEIRGKTLRPLGYGSIVTQLSVLAEALGMHVVFFDVVTKLPLSNARQVADLNDLLAQSHVVSLHVPETQATQWMIDEAQIAAMKPGERIDQCVARYGRQGRALGGSLAPEETAGRGDRRFPGRSAQRQGCVRVALASADNVLLTPPVGGSTMEAQENNGVEVAEKLVNYSDNGPSTSSVNFPEVALPAHHGKHRLLDIRRNVRVCYRKSTSSSPKTASKSPRSIFRLTTPLARW